MKFLESLQATISQAQSLEIPEERKKVLQSLIDFIQDKIDSGEAVHLNFICTHNSRRSQFSQIWAQTAAAFYRIPAYCYSGGVEVTAFNDRAVASIRRSGFRVAQKGVDNPFYFVFYSEDDDPIAAFSKLYDDPINSKGNFAAVMTCAHADENCPFIPGASARIPVRYEDPKAFDDTPEEASRYDERSLQIASEMFYVFANVSVK